MLQNNNWLRIFFAALLSGLMFLHTAFADKPKATVTKLEVGPAISENDSKILKDLDIAKRFREALVNSGMFAMYSRDSAELKGSIEREKELAGSGLAKENASPDYQYTLSSYFFSPKVTNFSSSRTYAEIPYIKGIYDRQDAGRVTLHLAAIGSDGEILFEETGKASFSTTSEVELKSKPKKGRPPVSSLEKMIDQAIYKILDALDSSVLSTPYFVLFQ